MVDTKNTSNSHSESKLGTMPIGKLMAQLAIPSIIAQVINILYNIVDRIYVGHMAQDGALALTALGVSSPLILIVSAFAAFIMGGSAPLAAIALGKKDRKEANRIAGNSLILLTIMGIALMIVCYALLTPLLRLFGASEATLPFAYDYTSIYLTGTLSVMFSLGMNAFISCQGEAKRAMVSVVIGAVANIILDPIFIFVFHMGVKGAAIATVLSQTLSAIYVIGFLLSKHSVIQLKKESIRLNLSMTGKIYALGISMFIMQVTESAITIVFNKGLLHYGGDLYVGGMTILQSVMQLLVVPLSGFTNGIQPIISYNLGAGNHGRIKQTVQKTAKIMLTCCLAYYVLVLLFPNTFASLFTKDAQLIAIACKSLPIYMGGSWIFGMQMTAQAFFVGTGQAKRSLFLALLRKVILLIPLAIVFPRFMGVQGIFWSEPIADILSASISGILLYRGLKTLMANTAAPAQGSI